MNNYQTDLIELIGKFGHNLDRQDIVFTVSLLSKICFNKAPSEYLSRKVLKLAVDLGFKDYEEQVDLAEIFVLKHCPIHGRFQRLFDDYYGFNAEKTAYGCPECKTKAPVTLSDTLFV